MQPVETAATRKPRLLIILNRFVIGGQAVDTIPLAWYLKDDFEILILYGEKEKDEVEPDFLLEEFPLLKLKKIKNLRRSINPFIDVAGFFSVLYTLNRFKPDIVHTHGAKSGFIGRVAGRLSGVPVIIHTFHGHFFHSYFSKRISSFITLLERFIGKITTCAIALSDAQKTELVDVFKILPEAKVKVIPLGFAFDPENKPWANRQSFRNRYGLKTTDVAIGIVGRIVPIKNHSFFIEVVQTFLTAGKIPPVAFFIIGDGDLRTQVEKEMKQKDLSFNYEVITEKNRIVFTSWITNMPEVMDGLDIVVLTSLNEGTPLSIIEAQFFKKPVVSTNVGGVKDTMKDGVTGFIVERNDLTAFTQKLRLLVEDKVLRSRMGEEGHKFASTKFSKQREIAEIKSFYFALLREKNNYF